MLFPAGSVGQEGVQPFQPWQTVSRTVRTLFPLSRTTPGRNPALFGSGFSGSSPWKGRTASAASIPSVPWGGRRELGALWNTRQ